MDNILDAQCMIWSATDCMHTKFLCFRTWCKFVNMPAINCHHLNCHFPCVLYCKYQAFKSVRFKQGFHFALVLGRVKVLHKQAWGGRGDIDPTTFEALWGPNFAPCIKCWPISIISGQSVTIRIFFWLYLKNWLS